jgi:hypothetical protein
MILIPYRRLAFDLPLHPSAVVARLSPKLVPHQPWFRSLAGKAEFIGKVTEDRITIDPVISGRSTYLPHTTGRIIPTTSGCTLALTQTLRPVEALVILVFALVSMYLGLWANNHEGMLLWFVLFLLFHAGMCVISFWPQARRTEALLRKLLANQTMEQSVAIGTRKRQVIR